MPSSMLLDSRLVRRLKLQVSMFLRDRQVAMALLRRTAVSSYRRRYCLLFWGLLAAALAVLYGLFVYGVVCSNVQIWKEIHDVCRQYKDNEVVGTMCHPLCEGRVHSLSCQPLHSGKELVFSAVLDGVPLVFKSSRRNLHARTEVYAEFEGRQLYPSEDDFVKMVAAVVENELNVSATEEQLSKLIHLAPVTPDPDMRETEMKDLWRLLQDHEYLAVRMFSEQEILPALIGSCGDIFAVDFAEPLSGGGLWEHEDEVWSERLRHAVIILELLERLETTAPAPLRLCDVRLSHIGHSFDGAKAVVLDGDSLVTQSMADLLAGDGSPCTEHSDCHFFDCHAACEEGFCQPPSTNNNLQAICEKVFLGARWGGALLLPGLLASPHAPPSLAALLRLCAHPHGEEGVKHGTPDDIRDRFVATVEEMVYEMDLNA
ncbi:divergent protein kinase domain 1C [Neocloeon triangulifer]|uniref:divergent protein kinase domain 1C n=1 Tax=Neocloeon triangulifer TaxID=2078957 RepID=UPI00286EF94C|nr:divergent protein kinase domain 1C [Neocloeon triangulifer]